MKSEVPNYNLGSEKPDSLNQNAEKAPDLLGETFILHKAESVSVITRGLFCTLQWFSAMHVPVEAFIQVSQEGSCILIA